MVKVGPNADYPVGVRPQSWEEPDNPAPYAGIFTVTLNVAMRIVFVPEVRAAPPWDAHTLPSDLSEVTDPQQARLAEVVFSSYAVTVKDTLAGQRDRFFLPPDVLAPDEEQTDATGVVWYVTAHEFAAFQRELDDLSETCGGLHQGQRVSRLRDRYAVVRFVEREIVQSGLLRPYDAHLLALDV